MDFKNYWNEEHKKWIDNEIKMDDWLDKYQDIIKNTNTKILDLGCGLGNNSLYLRRLNKDVIAVDYSKVALDFVSLYAEGTETLELDISKKLPFKDNEFELIIADLSLHYFSSDTTIKIMKEIKRILKDDGILLARVNSTKDINYGSNEGVQLEENYYFVNGYNKRFFNKEDSLNYFSIIGEVDAKETQMDRYSKIKEVFEIKVRKIENKQMKFKEFIDVKTLVKKGNVEKGEIGTIIDALSNPWEGYIVEFCNDVDYAPWGMETYYPYELEEVKKIK